MYSIYDDLKRTSMQQSMIDKMTQAPAKALFILSDVFNCGQSCLEVLDF